MGKEMWNRLSCEDMFILSRKKLHWMAKAKIFHRCTTCGRIVPYRRKIGLLVDRKYNDCSNIVLLVYTWYNLVAILYYLCTLDTISSQYCTACVHLIQSRRNIVLPVYTWYNLTARLHHLRTLSTIPITKLYCLWTLDAISWQYGNACVQIGPIKQLRKRVAIHLTFITPYGVKQNKHQYCVQNVVTAEDLFKE